MAAGTTKQEVQHAIALSLRSLTCAESQLSCASRELHRVLRLLETKVMEEDFTAASEVTFTHVMDAAATIRCLLGSLSVFSSNVRLARSAASSVNSGIKKHNEAVRIDSKSKSKKIS